MENPLDQAFQSTLVILTKIRTDDLTARTPCASWDVRALVNHVVGSARWWAALVAGEDGPAEADHAAGDFVAAYEESIRLALAAFAAEGALEKMVKAPFGEFPGAALRDFAATDQFTHGWDLARAIGYPADLDPELAALLFDRIGPAITDALRGPDGQAPFGPAVEAPAGAGPVDRFVAYLGRRV